MSRGEKRRFVKTRNLIPRLFCVTIPQSRGKAFCGLKTVIIDPRIERDVASICGHLFLMGYICVRIGSRFTQQPQLFCVIPFRPQGKSAARERIDGFVCCELTKSVFIQGDGIEPRFSQQ